MFLDSIVQAIMAPVNFIRGKIMGVENIQGGIQIDVNRVKQAANEVKNMPGEAKSRAAAVASGAKDAAGQAKAGKKKMGLFSKKKVCESCGQKLHPSWDQCPYCGAGGKAPDAAPVAAPAPTPSPKARTMAIDAQGGAATGPVSFGGRLAGAARRTADRRAVSSSRAAASSARRPTATCA